jgi:hypothetical protein
LTTVACGPFTVVASTTPGTTYYIDVFDFFGGGGGNLQLNIGRGPNITMNLFRDTRVDRAGVVYVKGTYQCTDANYLELFGSLTEIVGGKAVLGQFDKIVRRLSCDGQLQYWQATVANVQGSFAPGKAVAVSSAFACGDIVCVFADKVQVLNLAHRIVRAAAAAPVTSSRTQAFLRSAPSSRRAWGAAANAGTSTWGR